MSEPDRRYDGPFDEPHGSSAYPDQPLADQPTDVVDTVGYVPRHDTAAVTTPITHPAARSADREPTAWLPDEDAPLPLGEWDEDPDPAGLPRTPRSRCGARTPSRACCCCSPGSPPG